MGGKGRGGEGRGGEKRGRDEPPLSKSWIRRCILPDLHAIKVLFYAASLGVVTSGHVTKTQSHHLIRHFRKPPPVCILHDSIFYRTGVIAD